MAEHFLGTQRVRFGQLCEESKSHSTTDFGQQLPPISDGPVNSRAFFIQAESSRFALL